ncbi:restriction endonuclease [Ruminococcaceae bacterium OttesenSCG-928-L11]|nr:restriction endonuclease [Ruminococcaceae bacterium OttesenSCG-928-L11]
MSPEEFERYALLVLQQQVRGMEHCRFEHNKIIEVSDGNYQIDGYIEFDLMGVTYKTLVECKHYKSSISREKVQVLYDKLRACGAQKGILISSSNFQSGAITYATQHGIALVQLTESSNQYFTKSMYDTSKYHRSNYGAAPYIGIMQTSVKEGVISSSYLSSDYLRLKEFLEETH